MVSKCFKKLVLVAGCICMFCSFAACTGKQNSSVSEEVKEQRLYDNHYEFMQKVRENLGVPDKDGITYVVDKPIYKEVYQLETVYLYFLENGEFVASAECSTKDGSLVSSIYIYNQSTEEEVHEKGNINADPVYYSYNNARYGFSVQYPDFLIPEEEGANGDGKSFISADGEIIMQTWGSHFPALTEAQPTLDGLYDFTLSYLEYSPTYTAKGDNYFVLSGFKGDNIVYEKHFLKSDYSENVILIEYPGSLKEEMDDIVTHISDSMKTGKGIDSETEK